jgi:hypothetical protein
MEAVDYMVSHQEDGILQYYCSCLCFFQQVTGCPGIVILRAIVLCVFVHVNLSAIAFGQVKILSCKLSNGSSSLCVSK